MAVRTGTKAIATGLLLLALAVGFTLGRTSGSRATDTAPQDRAGLRRPGVPAPARSRDTRHTLQGAVLDADGNGLRHATVRIAPRSQNEIVVSTDQAGRYAATGLEPGDYVVSAEKPGFAKVELQQEAPFELPSLLRVSADSAVLSANFILRRAGAVVGVVVDSQGAAAANALVGLFHREFDHATLRTIAFKDVQSVRTDDHGRFRLHSVPASTFYVAASLGGAFPESGTAEKYAYLPTFHPKASSVETARPVAVSAGQDIEANIQLVRAGLREITGTVIDSRGTPVSEGIVRWTSKDRAVDSAKVAPIERSGRFVLEILDVPGTYWLSALTGAPGNTHTGEFASRSVTLPESLPTLTNIRLQTSPGVALRGTVVIEGTGQHRKELVVIARPAFVEDAWLGMRQATTAADGSFELRNVHVQSLLLVNSDPSSGYSVRAVRAGSADVERQGVDPSQPAHRAGIVVDVSDRPTRISGNVTKDGHPASATVLIFSHDQSRWSDSLNRFVTASRVSKSGGFNVVGLPEGDYFVIALRTIDRRRLTDPALLSILQPSARRVTISREAEMRLELKVTDPVMRPRS